jgi:hypothetical protein
MQEADRDGNNNRSVGMPLLSVLFHFRMVIGVRKIVEHGGEGKK